MNGASEPMAMKQRVFLVILTIAAVFWLGGLTMRTIIANEFFISGTLEYDPSITMEQERLLFQLIEATTIFVLSCYLLVLVFSVLVLRSIRIPFKRYGWMLMASLLFFLFVPVEFFTGYLDIKFIVLWEKTKALLATEGIETYPLHGTILRETLSHRIGALSGVPVIATLCYFTAVAVIVLRPLQETPESNSNTQRT